MSILSIYLKAFPKAAQDEAALMSTLNAAPNPEAQSKTLLFNQNFLSVYGDVLAIPLMMAMLKQLDESRRRANLQHTPDDPKSGIEIETRAALNLLSSHAANLRDTRRAITLIEQSVDRLNHRIALIESNTESLI